MNIPNGDINFTIAPLSSVVLKPVFKHTGCFYGDVELTEYGKQVLKDLEYVNFAIRFINLWNGG